MISARKITHSVILVTGGAGFIGSNLCETLLAQDNEVVCLDNFMTGKRENIQPFLAHKNFRLIEGDIRNVADCRQAVDGVHYVLHQAALGSVPRSIKDPITTNDVNISGFVNMLKASIDAKVKRFVYAASSSTYGDHQELPKIEERIGKPLSPYAITKFVNEMYANLFAELYDFEVIGLRYFNVFGRKQNPDGEYAAVIPRFIRAFIQGQTPSIFGDGTQSRDFTYIDNVLQVNQLAVMTTKKEAVNTVYNVAQGESTSLNELVKTLIDSLKTFDPAIAEAKVNYVAPRRGDILHSLASIDKAKQLLDYQPTHNFREGIQEAIRWYWENEKTT
jgi:UDP-N-acetylglucosamine/UDP-N-acetylgalactosamine 4-epimerase